MSKREIMLNTIAEQNNLKVDTQSLTVFGWKNGYEICVYSPTNDNQFVLTVSVSYQNDLPNSKTLNQMIKPCRSLFNCVVNRYKVHFNIKGAMSKSKTIINIQQAIDFATQTLKENGYQNCCEACGTTTESTEVYMLSGSITELCSACFASSSNELDTKLQKENQKKENPVAGIVGAILGSLLGILCIVILGQMNYVAAISGIVMAVCVLKGYELLGGKLTTMGIVISSIIMIVMVYIGFILDLSVSVSMELIGSIDMGIIFEIFPRLFTEAAALLEETFYINLGQLYAFTAVGAIPTIISAVRNRKEIFTTYKMSSNASVNHA